MGLNHSPGIVTNGLAFYYDMSNTQKSWRGAPTTNYVPNADTMASWGGYGAGNDGTFVTEFGTTGYQMLNRASWNGILRSITLPSTGIYTFSAWVKYAGGSANNNGGTVYLSGWGGGDSAVTTDKSKSGWQRLSITLNCTNTTFTFFLISYGGTNDGVSDKSTWYVTMPQAEAGSVATPFVNGSRSATQAILDLTNSNTITANSLTYASDGTFSFNYDTPNYITVPLATCLNKIEGTMNFWLYPTRYSGGNGYFVNREDATANAVDWFWIGPYSDSFYFRIGNGSDCCSNDLSFGSVSTVIPLNNWINMCFTWKANGTSAIYKNGVLITSRAIGNIPATNPAANGRIGLGHANGPSYFDGKIPTVQIYNRQFTDAEVQQNFNAHRGRYGV